MDKGTIIRTLVLALALLNQFLIIANLNPIHGTMETWGEAISIIFTATASTWAWFKNNYITSKGNEQRKVLQQSNLTR